MGLIGDGRLVVASVEPRRAVEFIAKHHYMGSAHAGTQRFGLWQPRQGESTLVGVSIFDAGGPQTREVVFGPELRDRVLHHHRFALLPRWSDLHPNLPSEFLAATLRALPTIYWAVVAFADLCEGHTGGLYRATNAVFTGVSTIGNLKFRTPQGRIVMPRSMGGTWPIKRAAAAELGWEEIRCLGKLRYVWLLRSKARRYLKLPTYPYPK